MNGVGFGMARRRDPIRFRRTGSRNTPALCLAVLLMFAAASSAGAEQRVAQVAGSSALPPPMQPRETHEVPGGGGGGFLVQVSSSRSEEDAEAAFKTLQRRYPTTMAGQALIIKRADLGDKGVYYRGVVGPFDTAEEASRFCTRLRTAGGACVIQRN
jgi:SPOR domain